MWFLGYPDQALRRIHETLALARELSHPFSLAVSLFFAAGLHQSRREGQETQEHAEAMMALSTEQGFPYWLAVGTILRGWALAEQGKAEEGITQIRQGLNAWQATGGELFRPYIAALLADAYGKVGQTGKGLTLLAKAVAVVNNTGERAWEAELYRLKGELLLKSEVHGPQSETQQLSEAEVCFRRAIDIARHQSAKSLELRATMSLARLLRKQGKSAEAQQRLAEIYGWFTEGFDTADLIEAKSLLEELA